MRREAGAVAALALWACGQPAKRETASNSAEPVNTPPVQAPAIPPPATGPDAQTPLAEPKGPIDSRSIEAAGQVVQHYGALIEQGRGGEAEKLWEDGEAAKLFAKGLPPRTHLEIGELGESEGAAGSIYTTVPVVFYGSSFRRPANVILRRVNDVPGSTKAQRRWHITRIEWNGPA
jgi:hypothetical protein